MRKALNALIGVALAAALLLAGGSGPAWGCPFCSAPSLTLSEQVAQADAVVLVEWTEATRGESRTGGSTTYKVAEILKGPEKLEKGQTIRLPRYRPGEPGDLFVLMGNRGNAIEWDSPLAVTRTGYKYITQAPDPKQPIRKRLAYFLKYLEFPDQLVSNDAYAEFANAPYKEITPLADQMPRERIRKWLKSPEIPVTRRGLYGMMLGLCGDEQDARMLREMITEPSDEFRLGIDGVMAGYLMLTGDAGLDVVDRTKLATTVLLDAAGEPLLNEEGEPRPLPFSETYAAMQALRFMQKYAPGVIDDDRLKESMRLLIDRPELADLVIADLARWKDWAVQDRLMQLYGAEDYDIPSIKRAIVQYMLASVSDAPSDADGNPPEHVVKGKKYLAQLEKKDPKTVKKARRYFFLK